MAIKIANLRSPSAWNIVVEHMKFFPLNLHINLSNFRRFFSPPPPAVGLLCRSAPKTGLSVFVAKLNNFDRKKDSN
jgi:hypothetical protein